MMTYEEAKKNITAYVYAECENMPKQVIDALDIARQAIDKQIPKKPIAETHYSLFDKTYKHKLYYCPYCRPRIEVKKQYDCCPGCGQVIDWRNGGNKTTNL